MDWRRRRLREDAWAGPSVWLGGHGKTLCTTFVRSICLSGLLCRFSRYWNQQLNCFNSLRGFDSRRLHLVSRASQPLSMTRREGSQQTHSSQRRLEWATDFLAGGAAVSLLPQLAADKADLPAARWPRSLVRYGGMPIEAKLSLMGYAVMPIAANETLRR
jgi:hypothetical protein